MSPHSYYVVRPQAAEGRTSATATIFWRRNPECRLVRSIDDPVSGMDSSFLGPKSVLCRDRKLLKTKGRNIFPKDSRHSEREFALNLVLFGQARNLRKLISDKKERPNYVDTRIVPISSISPGCHWHPYQHCSAHTAKATSSPCSVGGGAVACQDVHRHRLVLATDGRPHYRFRRCGNQ